MPFYAGYSPPDLLDRHLASGGDIHTKELSQIPLTSQGAVAWTHFGGNNIFTDFGSQFR